MNDPGFFSNSQDFTISGGQFVDVRFVNDMKVMHVDGMMSSGKAVFELLEPYACLAATKDSSARHPPPRCHPGTRLKIRDRLMGWLCGDDIECKMLWVRGFAGTGKSAIAQSLADSCEEEMSLGGSYFFSRTARRNRLETVVPTLVYQLAITVPEYRSLIERRLVQTPLLLHNSPPVQFRKLIIEPFAALQQQHPKGPLVIILDGLDECEGKNAQLEIVEMITNALRTSPNHRLRWLIFSRPEAHLRDAFLELTNCGREELIMDAECRENVERYTRERISQIKNKFKKSTPSDWPPEDKLEELLDALSGLFVLASTCLNYVGDPEEADPQRQLDSLLAFMRRSQRVVSRSPLVALDLLYSRILEDISPSVFKTTCQILAYLSYKGQIDVNGRLDSAQALCNFLRLDQCSFYKAVRGLQSVMCIPEPEDAAQSQLQFHHASFQDFLLDPNRSGKFALTKQMVLPDIIKSGIFWYETDVTHFHAHSTGIYFDSYHEHPSLPGMIWASEGNQQQLSRSITRFLHGTLFFVYFDMQLDGANEDIVSSISNVDFRYWRAINIFYLAHLCRLDPSTSIVRVEPSSLTDYQLLEYLNTVIKNGIAKPAIFPLRCWLPDGQWIREYFIIGNGVKSVIIWRTKSPYSNRQHSYLLRCDCGPSEAQISQYQTYLRRIEWDEGKAELGML